MDPNQTKEAGRPPKLLEQVAAKTRLLHYSRRTETAYVDWARRFILFHQKRHPRDMGAAEIEAFLTHLAVERDVAASTQNQAFAALLFLYQTVLHIELPKINALRAKIPALRLALQGRVTDHHRFLLRLLLDELTHLEGLIARLNQRIMEVLPAPFAEAVQRLATIPGIGEQAAQNILAEIGTDMDQFPTAGHLASWTGMCPGNNESAGKRRSSKTTKGNRWLRATLVQVAWAASHSKATYLSAQYRRLASRRGKKRALVALGHTILGIVYFMLKANTTGHELGPDYLDRLDTTRITRSLVRRLERLGHQVTLQPQEPAA